jgi:hypothetical protein
MAVALLACEARKVAAGFFVAANVLDSAASHTGAAPRAVLLGRL